MSSCSNLVLDESRKPISVYVHIPFCQTKCPYCDFNSYETSRAELLIRERAYIQALLREYGALVDKYEIGNRFIESIFFGGGTPSLLSADSISFLLEGFGGIFPLSEEVEITLEANPRSVQEDISSDKLIRLRQAGVNRLSFGAQSFLIDKLKFLGRNHSPKDTLLSYESARSAGFNNINLDLIFGLKDEKSSQWKSELREVVGLRPEHLSAYMLTIEPGTVFGRMSRKGEVFTSDENTSGELFEITQEILDSEGYCQYEISNYQTGERVCKHNMVYWKGGEYLGLGAGAHSFLRAGNSYGLRWSNIPSPSMYVGRVNDTGLASQCMDPLDFDKAFIEYVALGLRMAEGIPLATDFDNESSFTKELCALIEKEAPKGLVDDGYLNLDYSRIFIPRHKFGVSDAIIQSLIDCI